MTAGHKRFLLSVVLFILSFTAYFSAKEVIVPFGTELPRNAYLLTGDEPRYLFAAHSVAMDGDGNLYNNILQKDDLIFSASRVGVTDYFYFRSRTGKINYEDPRIKEWNYFPWDYGLAVLLAPAYRIGYALNHQVRYSVVTFLNLLAALLVVLIFHLSLSLTQSPWPSFWISLVFGMSVPAFPYSASIFPDMPSAFTIVLSILLILQEKGRSHLRSFIIGLLIAILPWFHVKNSIAAVILAGCYLWETRTSKSQWILFAIPLMLSLILKLRSHYFLYGVWYPVNTHLASFSLENALRSGLLGMLFDRARGGVFWYMPVLAFSFGGIILALQDHLSRNKAVWLSILVLLYMSLMSMYEEWWGGTCPPLRYALIWIWLLAPFTVYTWTKIKQSWIRIIFLIFSGWGLMATSHYIFHPGNYFREYNTFLYWLLGDPAFFYLPLFYVAKAQEIAFTNYLKAILLLLLFSGLMILLLHANSTGSGKNKHSYKS